MEDYISIIIPCYNAEKYLETCLQSILNQTYRKWEIILIDDCSKDKTWKIIENYTKKYKNIRAIQNDQNRGAGYSRNEALQEANYDLVSFIDADDYIDSNFYEVMMKQIKKDKSDVVVCDIYVKYEEIEGTNTRQNACKNDKERLSYIHNGLAASPCNKILRKEKLLEYPFPTGIMNEDIATIIPILLTSSLSYTADTCYYYIQRKNSVQNSHINKKRLDLFKSLDLLEERYPRTDENKKYWEAIIYNQVITFLFYYITQEKDSKSRKEFLKEYNTYSKKYQIEKNPFLQTFYQEQGPKHRYYYKGLVEFTTHNLYYMANSLISFYQLYTSKIKKSVIKDSIKLRDIIEMAKYQEQLPESNIKLSVVIPNYNYEKFFLERIYSILYQTEKIAELVILDDYSTDNSRTLIDEVESKINKYIKIKKIYNKVNSGTAFKQWERGFLEASGDYIWIAEADDYSNRDFLKNALKPIKEDPNIVISYTDTAFINKDGFIVMNTIKNEIDILKSKHWNHNFIKDGKEEIKDYAYLNCTIANVSSVIFKKDDYTSFFTEAREFKQAGDWLFYINVMSKGKIAYSKKTLNYYRLHGDNVTSVTKKQKHFNEIKEIHKKVEDRYGLDSTQKQHIQERYEYLKEVWNIEID